MVATQNTEWGFFGTFRRNWSATDKETQAAWDAAVKALTAAGYTEAEAQAVLDDPLGRHMADQIKSRRKVSAAMEALVKRWALDVARTVGRNPAADKERTLKLQAAKAKVERLTLKHRAAAVRYTHAAEAERGMGIPIRNARQAERELQRAAIALVEAIRESL